MSETTEQQANWTLAGPDCNTKTRKPSVYEDTGFLANMDELALSWNSTPDREWLKAANRFSRIRSLSCEELIQVDRAGIEVHSFSQLAIGLTDVHKHHIQKDLIFLPFDLNVSSLGEVVSRTIISALHSNAKL